LYKNKIIFYNNFINYFASRAKRDSLFLTLVLQQPRVMSLDERELYDSQ